MSREEITLGDVVWRHDDIGVDSHGHVWLSTHDPYYTSPEDEWTWSEFGSDDHFDTAMACIAWPIRKAVLSVIYGTETERPA